MLEVGLYLLELLAIAAISFATVYITTPKVIGIMKSRGFVGKDMNKYNKPAVAELGGAPIFLGFAFASTAAIFMATYLNFDLNLTLFMGGMLTIILIGFIGTIDDIIGWKKGIRQWQHALFPIVAALPLMAVNVANPPMTLPIIGLLPTTFILPFGAISFGVLYSLILVPIGVTGASNATNILAGLNGLEAGLALMILSTLGFVAFVNGEPEALIFSVAMAGAMLAFLIFNKYPAKIFGGDGLTLMAGASIAVVSILGDMEKIGIMIMAMFFVELVLKARTKFQGECFGVPQKNGLLLAPKEKQSLTHYFMAIGPATERLVVVRMLLAQAAICAIVLLIVYLNQLMIISI